MRSLHLAESLITLMEEDPGPVPPDAIEDLREALTGIRWPRPDHQQFTRSLVLRLERLGRERAGVTSSDDVGRHRGG